MNSNSITLKTHLEKWRKWSETADKSEEGWEGCYPDWSSLISTAGKLMERSSLSEEEFQMIEKCWKLSEEDEDLAEYAKKDLESCWTIILRLANSQFNDVRWQVFEVLGYAGNKGEHLLREAIKDKDAYCRRRAILSLTKLHLPDAKKIAENFMNDPDAYIRQAAKELIESAKK